jgi:PAS domain S-box-containing protein
MENSTSTRKPRKLRWLGVLMTAGILAAGAVTSGFFYMRNRENSLAQMRELVVRDALSMGVQVKTYMEGHERGVRALRELLARNPAMNEQDLRQVLPQLFPGSVSRSTVLVLRAGNEADQMVVGHAMGQEIPKLGRGGNLAASETGKALLPMLRDGADGQCASGILKLPIEGGAAMPALVVLGKTGVRKAGSASAVVGIFALEEMIEGAMDPAVTLSYDVVAYAEPRPFQRELMYYNAASYREDSLLPGFSDLHESAAQKYSLTLGDARVFLTFTPTPQWMRRNETPLPRVIFFLGLATTGVLASLFVYKSRRASVVEDLVQERTAELALANLRLDESRGTFSSLLEACPDAINGKDNRGRWTFANRAFLELAGIRENFPYKGLTDDEIIARARPTNLRFLKLRAELDSRVLQAGEGLRQELHLETPGQPRRYLDIHMLPVRGHDSGTVGLVAVCNDITELRRRINALQRSRERVKLLVENTATAIVEWDDQFRLIHWNPAAARLFGYDLQEVRNKPIAFFADPDGGEIAATALDSFLREREKTIPQTFRHQTRRGNPLTCEWQNTPLIDEEGRPLGVTSFIYDVTERTKAEQALRKRDGILRGLAGSAIGFLNADSWEQEAGEMLRHLVESLALSRVALVRVPPNDPAAASYTVLEWTNPYWEGSGTPENAAPGDPNAELIRAGLHEYLAEKGGVFGPCATLPAPWATLLAARGSRSVLLLPLCLHGEVWGFLRFDDCRIHREWSADEVDALRVVAGVLAGAIARQILTKDRLQMEKRLLLSQKRESLGLLAGGIARDFNQLIDDILGNASLGRTIAETDSVIDDCLSAIEEHGLRAAALCREMLAYAGHGESETGLASPNLILLDVLNGLDPEHQRRIHFRKELANGIPVVEMEIDQMREAIRAIVQNAVEAIGNQTGVIDIHTRAASASAAEGAEILIRDSGPGMDLQTKDRVFDPFFSTKMSGRGLGLTIAQSIVEAHGGHITMESEPGMGTTVLISLPVHRPKPELAEANGRAAGPTMGGLVLLVHSGRAADHVTALAFQQLGFDIEECVGVDQALRLLKDHPNRHRLVAVDPSAPGAEAPTLHRLRLAAGAASVILLTCGDDCSPALRHFAAEGLATLLPGELSAESLKGAVSLALGNEGGR